MLNTWLNVFSFLDPSLGRTSLLECNNCVYIWFLSDSLCLGTTQPWPYKEMFDITGVLLLRSVA